MYSGQEIVSQEECKIILSEFYEGVDCYDATTNEVKFTLTDWATANYNKETLTLTTRNFSCKPVIIEDGIRVTFKAKIPDGTTGLEVVMFSEATNRVRIMPLVYLRQCNTIDWDYRYDNPDWVYVKKFCIEENSSPQVVLFDTMGELLAATPTSLSIVGSIAEYTNETLYPPLEVSLQDASGSALPFTYRIISTSTEDITTYEYNSETGEYEQVVKTRTVTHMELYPSSDASRIMFTGLYDMDLELYSCGSLTNIGDVYSFCNTSYPEVLTEVVVPSTAEVVFENDEVIVNDSTIFSLLPSTSPVKLSPPNLQFELARQIVFKSPIEQTYDIDSCFTDPGFEVNFFSIMFYMYWDEQDQAWYMDLDVFGAFIWDEETIIDKTANFLAIYRWYNHNGDQVIKLTEGEATLDEEAYSLEIKKIPVRWCSGWYMIGRNYGGEIPNYTPVLFDDPRIGWDPQTCSKLFNCSTANVYLPDCWTCEEIDYTNSNGEIEQGIKLTPHDTSNQICTCYGLMDSRQYVTGCDAINMSSPTLLIGEYPWVEPGTLSASIKKAEWIYFLGTRMFMRIDTPTGLVYYVPLGDLTEYGYDAYFEDSLTGTRKRINLWTFMMLDIFKVPYKYLGPGDTISPTFWYDRSMGDPVAMLAKPIEEAGTYDFKVRLEDLIAGWTLPQEWRYMRYDWRFACAWIWSWRDIPTAKAISVGISDLSPLDNWDCNNENQWHHFTSNVALRKGLPHSPSYVGSPTDTQQRIDRYAWALVDLTTKQSEGFAYATRKLEPNVTLGMKDDNDLR